MIISSPHNPALTLVRKLAQRKHREATGLFVAEGEDLVEAAARHGWEPERVLRAGQDVEPALLAAVSALGSGTRALGVYRMRWSRPGGALSVYLHGVGDPGNVGAVLRCAHAFADGPVVLGPGCADPYGPKAVRASMGSIFARAPARASFEGLAGTTLALGAREGPALADVPARAPEVLCLGGEREGLPPDLRARAAARARIPLRPDGPDSLNVAIAAAVALYERTRMALHA